VARRQLAGARVLITGASSGIGRALALELARAGAALLLVARRQQALQAVAQEAAAQHAAPNGATVAYECADVAQSERRAAALEAAHARLGGLDILVNNAALGATGPFDQAAPHRLRQIMEVNFFAPCELIRAALPLLREGRSPLIVNVASILGHRGIPGYSEYCASKFALRGFSEALRAELAAQGIDVLVVSPGTTQTDFKEHLLEKLREDRWPPQAAVSPEYVARRVVRAMRLGEHEIVPHPRGRLLLWLNRLSPRLVDALMERFA
jgi:short-subunit dehydrogenase